MGGNWFREDTGFTEEERAQQGLREIRELDARLNRTIGCLWCGALLAVYQEGERMPTIEHDCPLEPEERA